MKLSAKKKDYKNNIQQYCACFNFKKSTVIRKGFVYHLAWLFLGRDDTEKIDGETEDCDLLITEIIQHLRLQTTEILLLLHKSMDRTF